MGASPDVDLDPDALRGVAADLTAVAPAVQALSNHVESAAGAAEYFGAPDAGGHLGAELAGQCGDLIVALAGAGKLISTLAEELRATADTVGAADEHSARGLRAAEG